METPPDTLDFFRTPVGMHFGVSNVSNLGHNGIVKPIDFHPKALEFIRAQGT
jgi:hypothetical protein